MEINKEPSFRSVSGERRPLTLSELILKLAAIKEENMVHGDLPAICTLCSGYEAVDDEDITVKRVLYTKGSAFRNYEDGHRSIPDDDPRWVTVVHFAGN